MGPKRLLLGLWIGFTTVSSIISIASLFDDVIAWNAFLRDLIATYRHVVDAVWGAIFGALRLSLPRWAHDYFTISSLMGVSILWALQQTAQTLHVKSNTVWSVLQATALDFTIGGNSFALFAADARKRLARELGAASPAAEAAIAHAERPTRTRGMVADGIAAALLLTGFALLLPFLVPPFLEFRDGLSARRARRAFAARLDELRAQPMSVAERDILVAELDHRAKEYQSIEALNALYHEEIRRQIAYYYLAVATGFFLLLMANMGLNRLGEMAATPSPER